MIFLGAALTATEPDDVWIIPPSYIEIFILLSCLFNSLIVSIGFVNA